MPNLQKKNVFVLGLVSIFCVLIIAPTTRGQLDVHSIWFKTEKTYTAGTPVDDPYDVGALVFGDGIISVRVIAPTGITEDLEPGPGYWYWDREDKYATLGDLYADFPPGNYTFVFNEGEAGDDSATVWIEPVEPTGFAGITNPAHGATDVPLDTTFIWNPCVGYGDYLLVAVLDLASDEDLYFDQLGIGEIDWSPGPLPSGVLCELEVSVVMERLVPDCETDSDDPFALSDVFLWSNEITFTTEPPPFYPVYIDIMPGGCPNPLNVKSEGVLPVAILGTEDLDVMELDVSSLRLRRPDHIEYATPLRFAYEDVATPFDAELCDCHEAGPDGMPDLVLHFDTPEVVGVLGPVVDGLDLELILTGEAAVGIPIEGADCIRVIKKKD